MSAPLTKKQQKALAFRSKQKNKKYGREEVIPDDIPEQDAVEETDEVVDSTPHAEEFKKRKRANEVVEPVDVKGKDQAPMKAKTAWDDEEGEEEGEGKKSKKEIKQRFILFVGTFSEAK